MKISVICTVKDEEKSIGDLLVSLRAQTRPPDEVIITDGGSTDRTMEIIQEFAASGMPIEVLALPGSNISQGRNAAIRAASGQIIASTDAGVCLEPCWLEELARPWENGRNPEEVMPGVVSGFFLADPKGVFEAAMGATALPSLGEISPESFLPSSRSVAFTKAAWETVGGYPEWLDYCEDLVFDLSLRQAGLRFEFVPQAIVHFRPRSSLGPFFLQYFRYARGDGKADLWRKRHLIRYAAYTLGPLALAIGFWYKSLWLLVLAGALVYLWRPYRRLWPMMRGWPLAHRVQASILVPVIRVTGDLAKMIGYPVGLFWRLRGGARHR